MQKHAKQLLRLLCCLSIAIVCGVAALSPSCAFAGENFVVTLGQYNGASCVHQAPAPLDDCRGKKKDAGSFRSVQT